MLPRVEHLPPSEWQRAGEVEGRALADTPLFRALFPDPDSRAEISSVVMSAGIRMALAAGKIVETTPSRMAFMVWDPPGHTNSPWLALRMPGMLLHLIRHVPRTDRHRLTAWEARWARRRHELPEPHWYAEMLAVDPHVQGYGLGPVLTGHGLARAEPTGTPTFLEADSARNATMYAKLGFELTEHGHDDLLNIPVWRMIHHTARTDPPRTPPNNTEPATATRYGG